MTPRDTFKILNLPYFQCSNDFLTYPQKICTPCPGLPRAEYDIQALLPPFLPPPSLHCTTVRLPSKFGKYQRFCSHPRSVTHVLPSVWKSRPQTFALPRSTYSFTLVFLLGSLTPKSCPDHLYIPLYCDPLPRFIAPIIP